MLKHELISKYRDKLMSAKLDSEKFNKEGKMVLFGKAQIKVTLFDEIVTDLLELTITNPNS